MNFYRIEHSVTGEGPYTGREHTLYHSHLWAHNNTRRHPSPYEEDLWRVGDPFRSMQICGFKSVKQLLRWFEPSLLEKISRDRPDWNVVTYTVDDSHMKVGKYQAVADKRFLTLIKSVSIAEFLTSLEESAMVDS